MRRRFTGVMCIRCGQYETAFDHGYCVQCTFAVRAEVEEGLRALGEYLSAWAAFDAWCAGRGELVRR